MIAALPRPADLTIDLRMSRHSGIGRYLRNLLPPLLPLLAARRIRLLADPAVLGNPPWLEDPRCDLVPVRDSIYSVSEQTLPVRPALWSSGLLWVPHYNVPLFYRGRLAVTIHDIAPLALPQILGPSRLRQRVARALIEGAVRRAAAVFCVSAFTKAELVSRLAADAHRIHITRPGLDAHWPEHAEPHREPDGAPYFLFVGNVKPNKNLGLLLRAFRSVLDRVPHRLLLAGRSHGFTTGDPATLSLARALGDRVRLTGEVSDEELQRLYAGATALVLPSLYEGFGLPLLEAMQLGCPVLCSRAGSLPEVAGPAALYFDPHREEELASHLLRIQDPAVAGDLRREGFERVRHFSFRRCADETAAALNPLLEQTA